MKRHRVKAHYRNVGGRRVNVKSHYRGRGVKPHVRDADVTGYGHQDAKVGSERIDISEYALGRMHRSLVRNLHHHLRIPGGVKWPDKVSVEMSAKYQRPYIGYDDEMKDERGAAMLEDAINDWALKFGYTIEADMDEDGEIWWIDI